MLYFFSAQCKSWISKTHYNAWCVLPSFPLLTSVILFFFLQYFFNTAFMIHGERPFVCSDESERIRQTKKEGPVFIKQIFFLSIDLTDVQRQREKDLGTVFSSWMYLLTNLFFFFFSCLFRLSIFCHSTFPPFPALNLDNFLHSLAQTPCLLSSTFSVSNKRVYGEHFQTCPVIIHTVNVCGVTCTNE